VNLVGAFGRSKFKVVLKSAQKKLKKKGGQVGVAIGC